MSKETVLEIVQSVLSDNNSDEVNSINDTVESLQIADILKSTYDAIVAKRDWTHTRELEQLVASGDSEKPTHMTLPADVKRVEFVNYDKKDSGETRNKFRKVTYKDPDDFLRMLNLRDNTDSNVDVITDDSGTKLHIRTDKHPQWYTSFDDETLIFDSYDSSVDSTLQSSKTQVMVYKIPSLVLADDTVPDLPVEAFPFLKEETKSRAALKIYSEQDVKSENESRSQNRWLSQNQWTVKGGIDYPNYGRK